MLVARTTQRASLARYNMLGKGHVDAIDAEVVLKLVEQIKSTEL